MGRGPGPTTNIAKFAVTSTNTQPGYTQNLLQGNGVHVSNTLTVPTENDGHYGYGMQNVNGDNFSLKTQLGPVNTYPHQYIQQQSQADWPSSTISTDSFGFKTGVNPTDITHQDASNNLQTIAWGLKGSNSLNGVPDPQGCTGGISTQIRNPALEKNIQLGDLVEPNGPSAISQLLGVALSRDGLFTAVSYKDGANPDSTSLAILDTAGNIVNSNKLTDSFGPDYNELGNLISMSGVDDGKYYIAVAQGGDSAAFNPGFDFVAIYQFDTATNALAYVNTSQNGDINIKNNPSLGKSAPGDIKNLRISDDGAWVMTCAPGASTLAGVVQLYKNPKTTLPSPNEGLQCVTVPIPTVGVTGFGNVGDLATVAPDIIGDDGIVAVAASDNGNPAQFPVGTIYLYRFNLTSGQISSTTPIELQSTNQAGDGYIPGLGQFFSVGSLKSLRFNTNTNENVLTITTDNGELAPFDIVASWRITYA